MKLSLTIAMSGLVLLTACAPVNKNLSYENYTTLRPLDLLMMCRIQSDGKACTRLGEVYEYGYFGFNKSISDAKDLYQKACDLNDGMGCYKLGNIYYFKTKGLPISKAEEFYKKGCELGYVQSCKTPGLNKNLVKAIEPYLPKAKNIDYTSLSEAQLDNLCNQNDLDACIHLGLIYNAGIGGIKKSPQKEFKVTMKSCNLGLSSGCSDIANMYRKGEGVKKSMTNYLKFKNKACNDMGNNWACRDLAHDYENGVGVSKSVQKAKQYYEKEDYFLKNYCERENRPWACQVLAGNYYQGKGVAKSLSTAKIYYGKACALGSPDDCKNYTILNNQGY